MEGKFYLTKEFKELQTQWEGKLKESGFQEIESGPFLKLWHSTYFFAMYSVEEVQETTEYYRLCDDFYWNYPHFKNDLQKEAWRLHAEGFSRRKIAQILKRLGHKISADSIQIIISSLKKIMHTHEWAKSESHDTKSEHDRIHSSEGLQPRR